MADIKLNRDHQMGLAQARKIAFAWAEKAEKQFDMRCAYEEGKTSDVVTFERSGVSGTLSVTASRFELHAELGFLLSAFKDRIQGEIEKNLDELLSSAKPAVKTLKKAATPK
jgi:putative polyhydroxyalkanoate system protein